MDPLGPSTPAGAIHPLPARELCECVIQGSRKTNVGHVNSTHVAGWDDVPLTEIVHRELGIPAVLSSVFESPVALGFYARLAMAHGLEHHAHGLDTWRWLQLSAQDLPFTIHQGNLVSNV